MNSNNYPKVGVAVIILRDEKILLGKRNGSHGAATWGFPGGHLEFNESLEGCAKREVSEETGLEIEYLGNVAFTNDLFEKDNKHYITLFVLANSKEGEVKLLEPNKCDEWKWFTWKELPNPLFLPIQNLLNQGFDLDKYLEIR